jgi:NADH-quinone oxidoreductase subunit G
MCLVEVEKMPKLMTACTLPVSEGMVVRTETPQVVSARKYMLEFLLTNHPLDCPVCDKGGECELQDMVFRYGAGESRYTEEKVHTPEKQFSPVVFYDAPRCILCFRCVRICNEGMGVGALGVINRGVAVGDRAQQGRPPGMRRVRRLHRYLPGGRAHQRHLPLPDAAVGDDPRGNHLRALRGWMQDHAGHAQRQHPARQQPRPLRHERRVPVHQGRYGFDFYDHPERLASAAGAWRGEAGRGLLGAGAGAVAEKFKETIAAGGSFRRDRQSNHTTNEENYYLQKFAREVLRPTTSTITAPATWSALLDALSGKPDKLATVEDLYERKAFWCWAPTWRWNIRCSPIRSAPTTGITRRASTW